jgi:hypothetical protein
MTTSAQYYISVSSAWREHACHGDDCKNSVQVLPATALLLTRRFKIQEAKRNEMNIRNVEHGFESTFGTIDGSSWIETGKDRY